VTQEAKLFARISAFGLGVAVVYWLLTSEPTGTVLLLLFGVASGIAAVAEIVGSRRWRRGGASVRPTAPTEDIPAPAIPVPGGPLVEPIPRPGWAPLGIGFGLGALALGAAFGAALAIAGLILTLLSARAWLGAAVRETDEARSLEGGVASREAPVAEPPASTAPPQPRH